jgi:GRIP and coiled-coil domain-containing protein 1
MEENEPPTEISQNEVQKQELTEMFQKFETILKNIEETLNSKFNQHFQENKLKNIEKNSEKIRQFLSKQESLEDDLKEEIEKNKLLTKTNELLTQQNVSNLNQFTTPTNSNLEEQLEETKKELEELKISSKKETEEKNKEYETLKTKMKDWKEKVKEITSKDVKKIEALKKIVSEKEEIILNSDKLILGKKFTILEHVKVQEESWCLIQYENEEKKNWVKNVDPQELPDSLQDALEEEYHKEIENFQKEIQKLNQSVLDKDEELTKYKVRAHAALKKKTDELSEEKSANDLVRQELEAKNGELNKEIEILRQNNSDLTKQVAELVEFQTKSVDLLNEIDELEKRNQEFLELNESLKIEMNETSKSLEDKMEEIKKKFTLEIENLKNEKNEMEEEAQRNIKVLTEKNRKVLQQYERENSRLQKSLIEKDELLSSPVTSTPKVNEKVEMNFEDEQFLQMAQLQANRDQELISLQQKIQELEKKLKNLQDSSDELKEEKEKIKRFEQRENANLEYLKNILVKYLSTSDVKVQKNLLPAISTVLAFSPNEKESIEKNFTTSGYWDSISTKLVSFKFLFILPLVQ